MNPDNGGKLCELDYKRQKLNLLNTIRRSRERYHRKLKFGYFSKIIKARAAARKGEETDIHDVLGISQPGLRKFLNYDHYGRESFQTHVFTPGDFWKGISKKRASDYGFLNGVYEASLATGRDCIRQTFCRRAEVYLPGEQIRDIKIIKEIEINDNPVVLFTQKLIDYSRQGLDIAMALEFNLMVWDKYFMASPRNIRADKFFLKDRYSGTELDFRFNRKFRISSYPIYSVNETEMGLCRTFQGISLVLGDDIYGRYDNNDEYVLHFSLTIR
jgi:hypothetical protein